MQSTPVVSGADASFATEAEMRLATLMRSRGWSVRTHWPTAALGEAMRDVIEQEPRNPYYRWFAGTTTRQD